MEKINQVDVDNFLNYNFDTKIESWLQKANELPEIEQEGIHDYFVNLRNQYLEADSKSKAADKEKLINKYKRHILEVRSKFDDSIELRDHLALINNTPELTGSGWMNFKKSKTGQEIAMAMSGEKELKWDKERNIVGYEVGDRLMSIYDMRKIIDRNTFDIASRDVLNGILEYSQVLGSYEDAGELDMYDIYTKVRNEVVDKGNKHSLINDKHVETEGGSFKVDLINRLQELRYQDLGITDEMLNNIDRNLTSVKVSDGINENEAIIITNELLKDEELTSDYLTAYYSQHIKSQYDYLYGKPQQDSDDTTEPALAKVEDYKKGSL